jgi:NADP-dependent 3-hydroxy acid dehydrogenase YdfG
VLAAAAEAGTRAVGFGFDLSDRDSAYGFVDKAVSWLGGLDVLVQAAGTAKLGRVEELDTVAWSEMLDTNVVGPAAVIAAALPELRKSDAPTVAVLSSHIVGAPWPGLVGYAASKAALEELCRGLRTEEPALRVVSFKVGNTATAFADGWDPERFDRALTGWIEAGMMRHRVLDPDEVARSILEAIAARSGPDELIVRGEQL